MNKNKIIILLCCLGVNFSLFSSDSAAITQEQRTAGFEGREVMWVMNGLGPLTDAEMQALGATQISCIILVNPQLFLKRAEINGTPASNWVSPKARMN